MAALLLPAAFIMGACGRGEIAAPVSISVDQLTVDASSAWSYVDLSTGATVPETSASTSMRWDIGFNATNVVLNGGANGPAGVTAHCLCQNAAATNGEILAMTPESQADAFTRITAASIPSAGAAWSSEAFAANKWFRYDILGDHRISPTFDMYLVRRGSRVYKLQLIDYYGPAGESRRITLRYARLGS